MLRFSIIVPVYNIKEYISDAINSILKQSFREFEIIVVDDGSTDGSEILVDEIQRENSDIIKVIHQKNKGLSEARNVAIDVAQGEYIVLLDSDDFLDENALYELNKVVQNSNCEIVVNRVDRFDDISKERKKIVLF